MPGIAVLTLEATREDAVVMEPKHAGDVGVDLGLPETTTWAPREVKFVGHGVRGRMSAAQEGGAEEPCAYYLQPRSSISKTGLMLANSVGVIDSGQRGELIAALRNMRDEPVTLEAGTRVVQVCHPALLPIRLEWGTVSETETTRGAGGFGSTG